VIFDLNVGSAAVRPNADSGYQACRQAGAEPPATGSVGAGMGATVGKWAGNEGRMRGGLGIASLRSGDLLVSAVAVVNAVGDVLDESGSIIAGARSASGGWVADEDDLRRMRITRVRPLKNGNTTLVALLTNARVSKVDANRIAQRGHDGMARAIRPVHTSFDGDIVFALASGPVESSVDLIAEMGTDAVAAAIRSGVRSASSLPGIPSARVTG
jgi:L-aminopeptidase/D-esterase-like protein